MPGTKDAVKGKAIQQAKGVFRRWAAREVRQAKRTRWPGRIHGAFATLGVLDALDVKQRDGVVHHIDVRQCFTASPDGKMLMFRIRAVDAKVWEKPLVHVFTVFADIAFGDRWDYMGECMQLDYASDKWTRGRVHLYRHRTERPRQPRGVWIHSSRRAGLIEGFAVKAAGITG